MRLASIFLMILAICAAPAWACDKCGADGKKQEAARQKQDRARDGHYRTPKAGKKYEVRVTDMECPNCIEQVTKAIMGIDGVVGVEGQDKSKTLVVTVREGDDLKEEDVKKAVEQAGYTWGGMKVKEEPAQKPND
ncbi:MAG: hypothetical protein HPKKFMNG_02720 [Planctomycetes bacterium]|nr:hypothetical protein [Planctomycetota bacterium]GIK51539.1 MAG: hypothetical protein BroJett014_05120 [Planctomycetota bacterium]HRJ80072.1 heavy-metal-associated domain-containing protein [Planctomycetota bacterium]